MAQKLTTEEFIKRAKKVHGEKYNYSQSIYVNGKEKIKIICPKHEEFFIQASNHLFGGGCQKCFLEKNASNTEEFINKAQKKFDNKFDYSKVEYTKNSSKVTIICPIHGEISQSPQSHLSSSHGCYECGKKATGIKKRLTTEKFIEKAQKKFGKKFDYSKVEYKKNNIKVTIICPIHGEISQTPQVHLSSSHGCYECAKKASAEKRRFNTEKFIEKSKAIHGDRYDYSETIYTRSGDKVKIRCKEHGFFHITARSHYLVGNGCRKCSSRLHMRTTEQFINECKEIHGDKYDYSETEYNYSSEKVKIRCKEHGFFYQSAQSHLQGNGCRKCGYADRRKMGLQPIIDEHKRINPKTGKFYEKGDLLENGNLFLRFQSLINNDGFYKIISLPKSKLDRYKADAAKCGLKFIGHVDKTSYKYQFIECGHYKISNTKHIRVKNIKCQICHEEKLIKEASEQGLVFTGDKKRVQSGKSKTTKFRYIFEKCGHEHWLAANAVRLGTFFCPICQLEKLKTEAADAGLRLLSNETRERKKKHYEFLDCGHKQWIDIFQVRTKYFRCNTCFETYLHKATKLYLLEINVANRTFLKLGFSNNLYNRIICYGLPKEAKVETLITVDFALGKEAWKQEKKYQRKYKKFMYPKEDMTPYFKSGFTECFSIDCKDDLLADMRKGK